MKMHPFEKQPLKYQLAQSDQWRIRLRVVRALKWFDVPEAREAIAQLRQDENHAVVGATLEEERT
jgi:HEAT repeat protein